MTVSMLHSNAVQQDVACVSVMLQASARCNVSCDSVQATAEDESVVRQMFEAVGKIYTVRALQCL
jgi:hypothetical protein